MRFPKEFRMVWISQIKDFSIISQKKSFPKSRLIYSNSQQKRKMTAAIYAPNSKDTTFIAYEAELLNRLYMFFHLNHFYPQLRVQTVNQVFNTKIGIKYHKINDERNYDKFENESTDCSIVALFRSRNWNIILQFNNLMIA